MQCADVSMATHLVARHIPSIIASRLISCIFTNPRLIAVIVTVFSTARDGLCRIYVVERTNFEKVEISGRPKISPG